MENDINIPITNHFVDRYRERVAKTSAERISKFANDAYRDGKNGEDIKNSQLRRLIDYKNGADDGILKIYKGFIYVFSAVDNAAITIYRIPNQINGIAIHI